MNKQKVSVGICTCNGEAFIKDQLMSIIKQSIPPDEIILSDDKSDDETVKIAEYLKQHLLDHLCIVGCNMAFRKCLFDKIKPIPYHYIHDSWIGICALWFGKMKFIKEPMMGYRQHGKNTSGFSVTKKEETPTQKKIEYHKSYRNTVADIGVEQWFGNPTHTYYAIEEFLNAMELYIDHDFAEIVNAKKSFYNDLRHCIPKKKIKSISIILKNCLNGRHKKFRGGIKVFLKDILFVIFSKNKDDVATMGQW